MKGEIAARPVPSSPEGAFAVPSVGDGIVANRAGRPPRGPTGSISDQSAAWRGTLHTVRQGCQDGYFLRLAKRLCDAHEVPYWWLRIARIGVHAYSSRWQRLDSISFLSNQDMRSMNHTEGIRLSVSVPGEPCRPKHTYKPCTPTSQS